MLKYKIQQMIRAALKHIDQPWSHWSTYVILAVIIGAIVYQW